MTLRITVHVGPNVVAHAHAQNMSNLADVSDYEVRLVQFSNPKLGIPDSVVSGTIEKHERRSNVWNLIRKMAELATPKDQTTANSRSTTNISDLLWQLPKEVSVDLLMELRDRMSDADKAEFDQRVKRRHTSREDRARDWRDENADALDERRR